MRLRIPTLSQATRTTTPRKAEGQATESARVAQDQVAAYQKQLAEYAKKMRDLQQAAEQTQVIAPPAAQDFSKGADEGDKRLRRSSARGSLLAGNTGGYNPATGGGRLGGRSLLG
jgi:hypothetical protein